eukprot:TRINITY_DN681_c0_g1_i1.p1 TRINITY_DN681_c0_g1~~TRINITY_DN681_c0_g1_i1.p1  ORF type:complete len:875 (+),score=47.75 TRINITY_DN681_c0_g1_i1:294-2627(+)
MKLAENLFGEESMTLTAPSANHLLEIEPFPVPKQEALAYLDNNGPKPLQYARVIIARGEQNIPDIVEYKVGPLPINESTTEIVQITPDGAIPWKKHSQMLSAFIFESDLISYTAYFLREIFKHSTGGFCPVFFPTIDYSLQPGTDCGPGDHFYALQYPVLNSAGRRLARVNYHFIPDLERLSTGVHLHPVPITFVVDTTDPDFTQWYATDFVYCQQGPFRTKEELLEKFVSGQLYKCEGAKEWGTLQQAQGIPGRYDFRWSEVFNDSIYSLRGNNAADGKLQPRAYPPQGARFQILGQNDPTGRRLRWLDWEAHIVLQSRQGIALYDITYKSERIVYELALQEQFVAYAGYGAAGQLMYFDSYFGLGRSASPLKRGVDCPETALYLSAMRSDVTQFLNEKVEDVICIFEEDMQGPLWRHYEPYMGEAYGRRASQLVVRMIIGLENYDYAYSISFKQDGSIHVNTEMHGYVETSFFDPQGGTWKDGNMGTRIHKYSFANLHDHLSGWKIDIDVKGINNSFMTYIEKAGTYDEAVESYKQFLKTSPPKAYLDQKRGMDASEHLTEPSILSTSPSTEYETIEDIQEFSEINNPSWFEQKTTKFLNMKLHSNEIGLKLSYDKPSVYEFINEDQIDQWGNPKGLAIKFDSTIRQVLPDDHPYLQAAAWTKYNAAILRHKDSESEIMAARYDWILPNEPIVSLDNYMDNETIRNQDLIAWVTVGVSHVPRTEDLPLISGISTGFSIVPWNYHDHMSGINGFEDTNAKLDCIPDIIDRDDPQEL